MKSVLIFITILAVAVTLVFLTRPASSPCFGLGCTGGYAFQDTALFTAPNSKLAIYITTSGFVPQGHDLGTGTALVKMYATDTVTDTMFLRTSPENIDSILYKGKTIPFNCSQMEATNLYYHLDTIGYKNLDLNEIVELRDAMTLINYGPKAGYLEGQTKYIIVGEHVQSVGE